MKITGTFTPRDGADWRAWLEANAATEKEVWLVYFKPGSGQTGIDYETSVEEALCFGWIDSIIQRIDEQKYARKFNPRRPGSNWSSSNKDRMAKLIPSGRMTPAGLATYDPQAPESNSDAGQRIRRGELPIPAHITAQMQARPLAWQTFQKLPPSHRRQYMSWVLSARREVTVQKRLAELIQTLEEGREPGLK